MPRPSSAAQRPDLAATLNAAVDGPTTGMIGLRVLPIFTVPEQTGQFPVIPKDVMHSLPETRRTDRGNYHRSDWTWDWDTYATQENGFEEKVDDREVKLYQRYFDAEKVAARRAYNVVMRRQEKRIADAVFNTGNFSANPVSVKWTETYASTATPIKDVKDGRAKIQGKIGLEPNTLIISYPTYLALGVIDEIVDRIKYTNPAVQRGDIAPALLAQAFGVDQVLVAGGLYNSSKKGQTASLARLWSASYAMLCVTDASPSIDAPCLGRTFLWTADSPTNPVIESYRDDTVRADIIRVRHESDEEFISTDAAYLMSNIS